MPLIGRLLAPYLLLTWCVNFGIYVTDATRSGARDYCEGEVFSARCAADEVVIMERAVYGRMQLGRCVKVDMGYIDCSQDVLDLAEARCSGRRSCDINIPDPQFERTQPCLELKSYLEASYSCQKVTPVNEDECRRSNFLRVTHRHGYLASVLTHDTWCGGGDTPWLIEGLPGQRVNITLMDFGAKRTSPHFGTYDSMEVCEKYAVIRETLPERSALVCGGRHRTQHVYLSNTNAVTIQVEKRTNAPNHFLLKYDIIGCPDPDVTSNTWFKRENDEITIGCKGREAEKWRLTCVKGVWIGEAGNCSQYENPHSSEMSLQRGALPKNLVIATVCGIAFVVCIVVLMFGVVFFRRLRRRSPEGAASHPRSGKGIEESDVEEELYLKPPNGRTDNYKEVVVVHKNCKREQCQQCRLKETMYVHKSSTPGKSTSPGTDGTAPGAPYVQKMVGGSSKNEYTHIWEMPLPVPGGEPVPLVTAK